MTAFYKKQNMTLCDALEDLYNTYGNYKEAMIDIYMEGFDGIERRKRVMASLRANAPAAFGEYKVLTVGDYLDSTVKNIATGEVSSTGQPASDVLYYTLENEDKIIVRPSGTEPKIKIYILAHADDKETLAKKAELYSIDSRKMTEV